MISVIIPSLFKVDRIYQTLKELSNCPSVGEIILLDNSLNEKSIEIPKVIYFLLSENHFVNPSWNLGVKLSNYDKLCLLGDDTWFDWAYLDKIDDFITEEVGCIGMSEKNFYTPDTEFSITPILPQPFKPKGQRPLGYCCGFFIHKSNWVDIPEDIKLWAGDDFLFYLKNNRLNYQINGLKCLGQISATLDHEDLEELFTPIKHRDMQLIKREIQSGRIENFLLGTIWENHI